MQFAKFVGRSRKDHQPELTSHPFLHPFASSPSPVPRLSFSPWTTLPSRATPPSSHDVSRYTRRHNSNREVLEEAVYINTPFRQVPPVSVLEPLTQGHEMVI
jgi:hypothetical protein